MKVKKRGLFLVLLLVCLLGLVGCGGGSGTAPTTLTLKSEANLDGHIAHRFTDPEIYGIGNSTTPIQVGHSTSGVTKIGNRGFVSFNLSSLPAGATIKSAILKVYQSSINGDPYNKLGNIFVDHVSYESFDHAAAGDPARTKYEMAPLDNTIPAGTFLSTDPTLGYKTLDVTAAVRADQSASRGRAQFRLSFQTEVVAEDSTSRLAYFYSGESDTNQPELVIQYTL